MSGVEQRRRVLRAGVVGGAALVVAPRLALRAMADGLAPAHGVWSVVARGDELLGLLMGADGPEVRTLVAGDDGILRSGSRQGGGAPLGSIALGLGPQGALVLGSAVETLALPTADPGLRLDGLLGVLGGEPDPPGPGLATPLRVVASLHDLVGRVLGAGGDELLTARLGGWTVHQHGTDDEADHLDRVTLRRDGRPVATLTDLGHAGTATLGGPPSSPVMAVDDGNGLVRVVDAASGREVAPLDASAPLAVVGTATGPVAVAVTDGRTSARAWRDGAWRLARPVTDPGGSSGDLDVLPVTGVAAVVVASTGGLRLVPLEGAA